VAEFARPGIVHVAIGKQVRPQHSSKREYADVIDAIVQALAVMDKHESLERIARFSHEIEADRQGMIVANHTTSNPELPT
jgi:hypothetical protein